MKHTIKKVVEKKKKMARLEIFSKFLVRRR